MSQLYEGYLSNVAFSDLVLTWQPDKIIGLPPMRDTQQEWKIIALGPTEGLAPVTVQNVSSRLYLGWDSDMNVISSKDPVTWYAINDSENATIGFQVPRGPTLEFQDGEAGTEAVLAPNAGELTMNQKWKMEP